MTVAVFSAGALIVSLRPQMPMAGWLPHLGSAHSISMDRAEQSVQSFVDATGDRDLELDELMEFQENFYALIKERSTGIGAFELLVDPTTGAVNFEPGPDMMWNTKYRTMMGRGGMMGWYPGYSADATMPLGSAAAGQDAQAWLDQHLAGISAGTPDAFYGYYTFHFEKNGVVAGMLSVNGYSGQVWYHSWHGDFIQARDFGA